MRLCIVVSHVRDYHVYCSVSGMRLLYMYCSMVFFNNNDTALTVANVDVRFLIFSQQTISVSLMMCPIVCCCMLQSIQVIVDQLARLEDVPKLVKTLENLTQSLKQPSCMRDFDISEGSRDSLVQLSVQAYCSALRSARLVRAVDKVSDCRMCRKHV